ncbi:hypothetical protein HPB47_012119 [Ixodes persulcatus]|uniref:Uncharacterized protein n=1 Tax=Ixodes persulcatus TaxID=34615 RepID=A0AC60NUG1_IXOPE|nr:hypothetical protein HPB47_012119 [Ixodes persulcatus]
MSSKKRSKVETDSDSDSGPDDLAKKRYLTVREFKGRVMVDIREFYEDNNGDLKPGKKVRSATVYELESDEDFDYRGASEDVGEDD